MDFCVVQVYTASRIWASIFCITNDAFQFLLGLLLRNLYCYNFCFWTQQKNLKEIKQLLREAPLEENRKRELSCALHLLFKDWLYGNFHHLNTTAGISTWWIGIYGFPTVINCQPIFKWLSQLLPPHIFSPFCSATQS